MAAQAKLARGEWVRLDVPPVPWDALTLRSEEAMEGKTAGLAAYIEQGTGEDVGLGKGIQSQWISSHVGGGI